MTDPRAVYDARINVLRADEVGVWHCLLKLALELNRPGAPLRSVRLGRFDVVGADGRTGTFTPAVIARILELPSGLVESTIDKLLELAILARDGTTLEIVNAEQWFVDAAQSPHLRN